MRIQTKLVATVVGISLLGLPACMNNADNNQTNNSQTDTQVNAQTKEEIKVTGASTPYPAAKALAEAYETKSGDVKFTFLPSSQSGAGVTGVKEDIAEIGTVTREIKPEEDNGQIAYKAIGKDGLVIATHASVKGVSNITTEQLQKIYSGEIKNWKELGGEDQPIILLDRPEDESAKKILRKFYLGKELKTSPDAVIHRHESDLIDSVQNTPYSIGAFSFGKYTSQNISANPLSIDGIAPSIENIEAGKYEMGRTLGIVFDKNPSDSIQKFVAFVDSPEGKNALKGVGLVPMAQK